jgi:hypothetical protein
MVNCVDWDRPKWPFSKLTLCGSLSAEISAHLTHCPLGGCGLEFPDVLLA